MNTSTDEKGKNVITFTDEEDFAAAVKLYAGLKERVSRLETELAPLNTAIKSYMGENKFIKAGKYLAEKRVTPRRVFEKDRFVLENRSIDIESYYREILSESLYIKKTK